MCVCVFKTRILHLRQSTHKRPTVNMATGLTPYSLESLPQNIQRENEIFASKLTQSFESNQKGIFYITSLINFLLQL